MGSCLIPELLEAMDNGQHLIKNLMGKTQGSKRMVGALKGYD